MQKVIRIRYYSSTSRLVQKSEVRSFESIPGPVALPGIGTLWTYLPFIGSYKFNQLHIAGKLKYIKYGKLVREIVPGASLVHVYDPNDIAQVMISNKQYPERRSHLAVAHYRLTRPELYNTGGLLPTNGPEWWRIRRSFQKPISPLKAAQNFIPMTDLITQEFISKVVQHNDAQNDFLPMLHRLNFELIWAAIFAQRLNSFDKTQLKENSLTTQLIEAAEGTNNLILATDNSEFIWKKYWKTKTYSEIERLMHLLEIEVIKQINAYKDFKENNNSSCLLDEFYSLENVDEKDILGMVIDLLLGGMDTTAYTTSFVLYHLASNAKAQDNLYNELLNQLPNADTPISTKMLNSSPYLRAVLKECLRLNPISVGVSRGLSQDLVLSGYFVPKGTIVITQNLVSCRLEEYFPEPERFVPERWIKGSEWYRDVSPYLVLPFGGGLRTCIARRRAETNMLVFIAKVVRTFKLIWKGKPLGIVTPLVNKPDSPVLLELIPRS